MEPCRSVICTILSKKTIDQGFRKLDWDDPIVNHSLVTSHFSTSPSGRRSSIASPVSLRCYLHNDDLQRQYSKRVGSLYSANQQRVATVKYLGELHTYRAVNSQSDVDTFVIGQIWPSRNVSKSTIPRRPSSLDIPDDLFRTRLVRVLRPSTEDVRWKS
ncbi:hypothetical protein BKA83DRAFT_4057350 [Pisolithus microcarpus]|nr:hypothetical protein BKA83DRAFT_4057350 [Pisolithus microcarpus]